MEARDLGCVLRSQLFALYHVTKIVLMLKFQLDRWHIELNLVYKQSAIVITSAASVKRKLLHNMNITDFFFKNIFFLESVDLI